MIIIYFFEASQEKNSQSSMKSSVSSVRIQNSERQDLSQRGFTFNVDLPKTLEQQLQIVGAYLTLSTHEAGNRNESVLQEQNNAPCFEITSQSSMHSESSSGKRRRKKQEDQQFDESEYKGYRPKYKPRKKEKNETPHNTFVQLFSKLKICIIKISKQIQFNFDTYKKRPKEEPCLREVMSEVFASGKWIAEVQKGKAHQEQKLQNVRRVHELFVQFQQIKDSHQRNQPYQIQMANWS